MGRCFLVLLCVGACGKSTSSDVAAKRDEVAPPAADPWAAKPAVNNTKAAADPWAQASTATTPPSPPSPPSGDGVPPVATDVPSEPAASGGPPAGTYACQQMNFTASTLPTYTVTGISFVLDGNGGYSAPHFKGGPGTISLDGNVLSFRGGAMDGWRGFVGSTSSGPFVRIRLKDPTEVATSLRRLDGMCYRQR